MGRPFARFVIAALTVFCPDLLRAETHRIDGQVFVVTKGAQTIKLSLVNVSLHSEASISEFLATKRANALPLTEPMSELVKKALAVVDEAERVHEKVPRVSDKWLDSFKVTMEAQSVLRKVRGMADYPKSGLYLFDGLPAPLQTTKTDADGKFAFSTPDGKYVLTASAKRNVADFVEVYRWMVRVNLDADKSVMLASDNLTSSGSSDSVIETPRAESHVEDAMKDKTLQSLLTYAKKAQEEEATRLSLQAAHEVEKLAAANKKQMAEFTSNPKLAQAKAAELYPDLAIPGSALNKEFLGRFRRYQSEKKEYFSQPDWPIRLAKECSEALAASR
jgi:hypothetical protein